MGRPINQGMKFFTISADIFRNRKIQRLLRAKGLYAGMVFFATLCKIYGVNGYYATIDENLFLDVGVWTGLNEQEVADIIRYCVELELFDKQLVAKKNVLTSFGIQKQNVYAHKRTKYNIDPSLLAEEWMKTGLPLFNDGVLRAEPPVLQEEPPILRAEPPIMYAESTHTDKILYTRENKNNNYEEKDKTNRRPVKKPTAGNKPVRPIPSSDAARWAELQRLAADATGDRSDD